MREHSVDLDLGRSSIALHRPAEDRRDLLADDQLGAGRGGPAEVNRLQPYLRAFQAIDATPHSCLSWRPTASTFMATMQLFFIPGLARRGALRPSGSRPAIAAGGWGRRCSAGDRGGAAPWLRPGPVDHRQDALRRPPLLPAPGASSPPTKGSSCSSDDQETREPDRATGATPPGLPARSN